MGKTPTTGGAATGEYTLVMRKYHMDMSEDGMMGAGSSSICRAGINTETNEKVAIKVYKSSANEDIKLMRFKRQIQVLQELQDPFSKPADPRLWAPALDKAEPHRLFMRLWDHSHDNSGEIGPDVTDGVLYVITELANYSLRDYLAQTKSEGQAISRKTVKDMTKSLVLVMAGLHAKGFVHLDLKPENLMIFDRYLKLIDVDGCMRVGERIALTNPYISFSPCYCAPEWASFLLEEEGASIVAAPALDVWSVGCTICEFVTLDAIFKPRYANSLRRGQSHREAGFLFMEWLSSIRSVPIPQAVESHDPELLELLQSFLLVPDKTKRKSCAECLNEVPYLSKVSLEERRCDPLLGGRAVTYREMVAEHAVQNRLAGPSYWESLEDRAIKAKLYHSTTNPLNKTADGESEDEGRMPAEGARKIRHRLEDNSKTAMFQGTVWKLNQGKDPSDPANWLQRDMWVANNGSLCYFSQADMKRLVLLDSRKLHTAEISQQSGLARDPAIKIKCEDPVEDFYFAANSIAEGQQWIYYLKTAQRIDYMPTMRFGGSYQKDLSAFRVAVKNRRLKVDKDADQFAPIFKNKLWKVKAAGDGMKADHWFLREMWLARDGSLCYFSERDQTVLIYYTANDILRAYVQRTADEKSAKPFSFQVVLPPCQGMVFAPGEFAAETAKMRDQWMNEFSKFKS